MAVSYTYQQMQNQLAYELGYRTDLLTVPSGINTALSPIQQAIQNAIARWEREHFYFNELSSRNPLAGFTTQSGLEFYTSSQWAALATSPHIDKLWVLISGNRYTLNPRTEQYLSDTSVNPVVTGQPVDYSIFAETLRLYPIPNGAYPISAEGTLRFPTLVNASDQNAWLTDAADLIRATAKEDLFRNTIKNKDAADDQKKLIYGDPMVPGDQGYLDALLYETHQRPAVGKIRPFYF